MDYKVVEDWLVMSIPNKDYSENVILKCFYWYTRTFTVDITQIADGQSLVSLKPKEAQSIDLGLIDQIRNDLLDFKLREVVIRETQTIREIIIAKAFAYADLQGDPTTDVADPAGFDPAAIT